MSDTPYADKFVEFQKALDAFQQTVAALTVEFAYNRTPILDELSREEVREKARMAKMNVLVLYNDILTELQKKGI